MALQNISTILVVHKQVVFPPPPAPSASWVEVTCQRACWQERGVLLSSFDRKPTR